MILIYHVLFILSIFLPSNIYAICNYAFPQTYAKYNSNFKSFNYSNKDAPSSGEIKIGLIGNFTTLNPYGLIGVLPKDYYILLYDTLMISPLDDRGIFYPLLARGYCINNNKITIYMQKNATWHDNTPILAEDVEFTFNILKNLGNPYYREKFAAIINIHKLNDYEITFSLAQIDEKLLALILATPIIPKKYWQDLDFNTPTMDIPLSSGPYKITNITYNTISLEKNPYYWAKNLPSRRGFFNFSKVSYHYFIDNTSLNLAFKKKKVNFKKLFKEDTITAKDIKILEIQHLGIPPFKAYFLNTAGLLKDKHLRQAISYAYSYEALQKTFLSGREKQLSSLFGNSKFSDNTFMYHTKDNLQEADLLLNNMGYKMYKNKRPLKIKFLFSSMEDFKISQIFILNLKRLGIEVVIKIATGAQYLSLRTQADYDIILENLLFADTPQEELLQYFINPTSWNFSKINNPEITQLILDINSKINLHTNLQKLDLLLKESYIFIPLFYTNSLYIHYDLFAYREYENIIDIWSFWQK